MAKCLYWAYVKNIQSQFKKPNYQVFENVQGPWLGIWMKMVNTEIRLIIFFAAKDGEALYSQQKQDQELTVAQTMNTLLPNSDLHWRK